MTQTLNISFKGPSADCGSYMKLFWVPKTSCEQSIIVEWFNIRKQIDKIWFIKTRPLIDL